MPADYRLELAPDFPFRNGAFETWIDRAAFMRVTREGAGVGSGSGFPGINHTDRFFGQQFFGDNPDWAAIISEDGARHGMYPCYSQPGVLAARVQVTQDVYDGKGGWFGEHGHPGPKWIPFEPADLWDYKGLCHCDLCKPQLQPQRGRFGQNSNLLFRHGVQFAAEVAKRWPDKRVGMLAYEGHMLPPDFDLPDNLDVQVCMMWSATMGKEPYWHERNLQLLRDWSKKRGRQARATIHLELLLLSGVLHQSAALLPARICESGSRTRMPFPAANSFVPGAVRRSTKSSWPGSGTA